MIDLLILEWKSFKIIQLEYLSGIKKALDYICNGLGHCPEVKESDDICPFEIMLVLPIYVHCWENETCTTWTKRRVFSSTTRS